MYRAVMGRSFHRLGAPVRHFHSAEGRHEFHGLVKIGAPASFLAKALVFALAAPFKAVEVC